MLTPQEISNKEFVKAVFGGYDMSSVDDFIEKLTADYAALYKENAILKSKIKVLVEKVEEYRSTEDAMRMALLTAQKMGDELTAEAERKSAAMLAEAQAAVSAQLNDTRQQIKDEQAKLEAAKAVTAKFVAASRELVRQHGEALAKLDEIKHVELNHTPEPEPAVTREEAIKDTAQAIDNNVSKLLDEEIPEPVVPAAAPAGTVDAAPQYEDDGEPTKLFKINKNSSPDLDDTSLRPKFDFSNLQFGKNYTDSDN